MQFDGTTLGGSVFFILATAAIPAKLTLPSSACQQTAA